MDNDDVCTKDDKAFHKDFYQMSERVDKLFEDYKNRLSKKENKKPKVEDNASVN